MASNEVPICNDHDFTQFEEEYYGYRCPKCRMFIPYGCEPWEPEPTNNCCDDVGHDYIYDRANRLHYCRRCDQEPPFDWYDIFSD